MKKSTCCICSQIAGDATNDLVAQLIDTDTYVRRVPFESESFAIIPSVGPLVEGHVLLSPKQHFKSFAQIPLALENEFRILKKKLATLLRTTYRKRIHYFEHGSAKSAQQPMCTVEHAHLHVVPTDTEIWPTLQHQFKWQRIDSNIADLCAVAGDMEYLWYESPEGHSVIAKGIEGTFESQYLRKVFAQAVGINEMWNWREFPRATSISDTYTTLQRALDALPATSSPAAGLR
jgi:ATP adenylyltransferase